MDPFFRALVNAKSSASFPILTELHQRGELEGLVIDLLYVVRKDYEVKCVAIICDEVYLNVFAGPLFKRTPGVPFVMVRDDLWTTL